MDSSKLLDLPAEAALSLVSLGVEHGYRLAQHFAPTSEVGEVLTLSRPVVYRALKTLETAGLVTATETTGGRGQLKRLLRCTPHGERYAAEWLGSPVAHIRDMRTALLLKLVISDIHGLDTTQLIERQRATLQPIVEGLLADGDRDAVSLWRREQARSALRFLDEIQGIDRRPIAKEQDDAITISSRNQLRAIVTGVKHGDILSSVRLELEPGQNVTATITREATDLLQLAPGSTVTALFKATDVMIGSR
jgi:molybdate transport system regulatory protein